MNRVKFPTLIIMVLGIVFLLGSCAVIEKGSGLLNKAKEVANSDVTKAVRKSFTDITEEEEYYIGRAVAALILSRYPVYNNPAVTQYVNYVGNSVVFFSDRPETFAGYHFLILDTQEVNALAAPGGLIFITRGLLKRCQDEEMLACILAHEVGHVSAKHGLKSIKKSRLVEAFHLIGMEAAQKYGPEELSKLTEIFEDVLGDIVGTLIERGYDRKYEYEADSLGLKYAASTGYSPSGMKNFLQTMKGDSSDLAGKGWFKTHPSAVERIDKIDKEIAVMKNVPKKEPLRTKRFIQSIKSLR